MFKGYLLICLMQATTPLGADVLGHCRVMDMKVSAPTAVACGRKTIAKANVTLPPPRFFIMAERASLKSNDQFYYHISTQCRKGDKALKIPVRYKDLKVVKGFPKWLTAKKADQRKEMK